MGKLWSAEHRVGAQTPAESRVFDTPAPGALGDELKDMFDLMCDGPMPNRLVELADALEAAFQRGELHPQPCAMGSRTR